MPLVRAHEILSQYDMYFLNGSHFSPFTLNAFAACMVNDRTFIFHTDVY